jgi:hypothetical protein
MNIPDTTPPKLYKYHPFDFYSLLNLTRRELYFNKPKNLNDPYDCDPPFEINKSHRTPNNKRALFDKVRAYEIGKSASDGKTIDGKAFDQLYLTAGEPNRRFEINYIDNPKPIKAQISEKVGLTCFSKRIDNLLLWSHYADKHQGFCLEFDVTILLSKYPGTKLYKVEYPKTNKRISFGIVEIVSNPNLLERILTRKAYLWQYEEEWRLFCRTGGNECFGYDPTAISGVYFGEKMAYEHKEAIISILSTSTKNVAESDEASKRNYPNTQISGTQINVYDMELDGRVFKVKPIPFRVRAHK